MWRDDHLEQLAAAVDGVKADSRMVVVDHARVGDLCEWLCAEFRLIQTLYSVQCIEDDETAVTTFRTPRDRWYPDRVRRLDTNRCRPMTMTSEIFLQRLGGRRWDVVVSRKEFLHETEADGWSRLWLPVTTGRVCMIVNGSFRAIDGKCPIPERTPPIRDSVMDENPINDINNLPRYERRRRR